MLAPVANAAAQDEPGPATVGRRFAAYGLDLAFVLPIAFLTQLAFGFVGFVVPQASSLGGRIALLIVSAVVSFALAHGYLAATMLRAGPTYGQTFGRRALRIRVVRAGGAPLTQLTILTRETLPKYALPLSGLLVIALNVAVGGALLVLWLVDSLAALADRGGRSLHDRLAGTRSLAAAVVPHAAAIADRGSPEYLPSAGAPTDPDLAEYGPRLAAALLDGLFSYLIFGACAALAIGLEQLGVPGPGLPLFVGLFVLIFYSTLLTIRRGRTNGQTFGKQLMGIASSARMATGGTGLIGRDEVTREATDPPERVADAALEAAKAEAQLLRVELSLCLVIVDLEEGERTEGAVAARGVEDGLALLAELLARATIVARSLGKELQLVPVGAGQG